MSWFDINVDDLGYKNLMGSSRVEELLVNTSGLTSFSDVNLICYFVLWFVVFVFGYALFVQASSFGERAGSYCRVALVLVAVLFIYANYLVMLLWSVPFIEIPENMREGVFGDSFGTLNALFTGLAFSGVLITLLFQRKDLSETREQIANQQIESQFYSLLTQQQEVVRNFDLQSRTTNEVIARGRDCFREWMETFAELYKLFSRGGKVEATYSSSYDVIYEVFRADLGLYFRSLYSVFRFIEGSNHKDAVKFGLIVRSLLSDYELLLLFYNSLSPRGEKFKRFIYEYALFDNLDLDLLHNPLHALLLDKKAFGENQDVLSVFLNNEKNGS